MQGCNECGRFWVHYAELVFHNRGVPLELGGLWECHARSAKFWMSANTRTLVLAPFHKFLVPYQGFFGFPSIWDVAYLNCQPFPPRRGPSTKCTQSTRPGSRCRHCRHCSEPRIRRGGSIRPAEYSL